MGPRRGWWYTSIRQAAGVRIARGRDLEVGWGEDELSNPNGVDQQLLQIPPNAVETRGWRSAAI